MKIASFNINGIKARLPIIREWLEKEDPDVVGLQELKSDKAFSFCGPSCTGPPFAVFQ